MEGLLNSKRILITREVTQAKVFSEKIEKHGGCPRIVPLLKIDTVSNEKNDLILKDISKFDWIFFTSINGVNHFFNQCKNKKSIANCRIAVVGHKTEEALQKYGYKADFIPSTYNAETMAKEFIDMYVNANHVLFVRGNLSRAVLLEAFSKYKIAYSKVVVYETKVNDLACEQLLREMNDGIDMITFTSPSTVNAFVSLLDDQSLLNKARYIPCICIGTTTENVAIEQGFKTTHIPTMFTIDSMIDKMVKIVQEEGE